KSWGFKSPRPHHHSTGARPVAEAEDERSRMQVTETNADGLKREFKIVVPAGDIDAQISHRLGEIGRTLRLPGFRPGKVPMQILQRRFGPAVRGEVLETAVQSS